MTTDHTYLPFTQWEVVVSGSSFRNWRDLFGVSFSLPILIDSNFNQTTTAHYFLAILLHIFFSHAHHRSITNADQQTIDQGKSCAVQKQTFTTTTTAAVRRLPRRKNYGGESSSTSRRITHMTSTAGIQSQGNTGKVH